MTDDSSPSDLEMKRRELAQKYYNRGRIEAGGEANTDRFRFLWRQNGRTEDGYEAPSTVPIEELEQLADEWEDTDHNPETDPYDDGMETQLKCSQELRDLIAEYGGDA